MKYLILLCAVLALASCATQKPEVVVQTEYVEQNIPVVPRPDPVTLVAPTFYVVNSDNFTQFIDKFKRKNGTETFIAISVKDYENLSISLAELKRYVDQQTEVIAYYENQVKS